MERFGPGLYSLTPKWIARVSELPLPPYAGVCAYDVAANLSGLVWSVNESTLVSQRLLQAIWEILIGCFKKITNSGWDVGRENFLE